MERARRSAGELSSRAFKCGRNGRTIAGWTRFGRSDRAQNDHGRLHARTLLGQAGVTTDAVVISVNNLLEFCALRLVARVHFRMVFVMSEMRRAGASLVPAVDRRAAPDKLERDDQKKHHEQAPTQRRQIAGTSKVVHEVRHLKGKN